MLSPAKEDTLSLEVIMERCPNAPKKKKRPSSYSRSDLPFSVSGFSSSLLQLSPLEVDVGSSPVQNSSFENESPSKVASLIRPAKLFGGDDDINPPRNLQPRPSQSNINHHFRRRENTSRETHENTESAGKFCNHLPRRKPK
mmetsp:Transcript_6704/g.9961  ORF Transcript_6704/g.9961 Transcript_6704/m.9961 type:complete len:142 (-) Transcript_6704:347-772(-)